MNRIALLPSAFLISTIFFSFVSTTSIPIIHKATRYSRAKEQWANSSPSHPPQQHPLSLPLLLPHQHPAPPPHQLPPPLDLRGLYSRRYSSRLPHQTLGPAHRHRSMVTECCCASPRYSPTPSEMMTIWAEHGEGKRLQWDGKRLVSLHYDGDPRTVLPGMWIGGPKGTTREMTSLFDQFGELPTYITSYNTAGGG
jgi:hypothetical protein